MLYCCLIYYINLYLIKNIPKVSGGDLPPVTYYLQEKGRPDLTDVMKNFIKNPKNKI